ncbi:MAG: hypothetical protein ABFQ64_03630, partial [Campylobacterota bacterium]
MHKLLKRQLKRHYGKDYDISSFPQDILKLFEDVSISYDELYREKKFLEHTLDTNSAELEEANEKISLQNEHLK